MKVNIGLTRNNRADDYIPAADGYRFGAEQDAILLDYPDYMEPAEKVAERIFIATNAPDEAQFSPAQQAMRELLAPFKLRALSVGDTVTVGDVTLACTRAGWTVVVAA